MGLDYSICELRWERCQRVYDNPYAREWLQFQAARGLAANTLDAYGRDLDAYLGFLESTGTSLDSVARNTLSAYIRSIAELPANVQTRNPLRPLVRGRDLISASLSASMDSERGTVAEHSAGVQTRIIANACDVRDVLRRSSAS
jgi:hypothetical protein